MERQGSNPRDEPALSRVLACMGLRPRSINTRMANLPTDVSRESLAAALRIAIASVERHLPGEGSGAQDPVGDALDTLRRFQTRLSEPAALGLPIAGEPQGAEGSGEPFDLAAWARFLRQKRQASGLSRAQLARRSGLSESTLKNLEIGRHAPTTTTLLHLLAVPELKLEWSDPIFLIPPSQAAGADFSPNCWLAPGFDPIKMVKETVQQLNGWGGNIEQSSLYLDHLSAAGWCAIADQEDYASAQAALPLPDVAARVLECTGAASLDLIALGSGDGKKETRLAQLLLDRAAPSDLRLYLLDISQPLLGAAYKHAADVLGDRRGVAVFAIQGNMHHLPRYRQLLYTPQSSHRRRLAVMLGGTFGNLDNEILFLRNGLAGLGADDLLLLDIAKAYASADRPSEIQRLDPRLSGRLPLGWQQAYERFLSGPILRYTRGATAVEFSAVLDRSACTLPGSYAVDLRAQVKLQGEEKRAFTMMRFKRYDPEQLSVSLAAEGWATVGTWRYGDDRLLQLFQRRPVEN